MWPSAELHCATSRKVLSQIPENPVKLTTADYKNMGFYPHMTIAFRDLKKNIFPVAWEEFKNRNIDMHWQAHELCLLKHNGKKWEVFVDRCF